MTDTPNGSSWLARFTQKTGENDATTPTPDSSSLVESIVREAERKTAEQASATPFSAAAEAAEYEATEATERNALGRATTMLAVAASCAVLSWAFLYTLLDDGNTVYEQFGANNLTRVMQEKEALAVTLTQDVRDTQGFITLLNVEQLAYRILAIDLGVATPHAAAPIAPVATTDETTTSEGDTPPPAPVVITPDTHAAADSVRAQLGDVIDAAEKLASNDLPADVKKDIGVEVTAIRDSITAINPAEADFPSALTRGYLDSAQSAAKNVLTVVKSYNLKNLIADLKKQARGIDLSDTDAGTNAAVTAVQTAIDAISPREPSSIETALRIARAVDISTITDRGIYEQITSLIGDGTDATSGDLAAAATLAHNLGRANFINELNAQRIVWSSIIDRVERISRLGADLTPDAGTVTDVRRDLNPMGSPIFVFTNFAGKEDRDTIEVRGRVQGEGHYREKNFALVADFIDALEGSVYFKDADGFVFTKNKDSDDRYSTPLNLRLSIQHPYVKDSQDFIAPQPVKKLDTSKLPTFAKPVKKEASTTSTDVKTNETPAGTPADETKKTDDIQTNAAVTKPAETNTKVVNEITKPTIKPAQKEAVSAAN